MDSTLALDREFMLIIRAALLMIVRAIEKKWMIKTQQSVNIGESDNIAASFELQK